MLTGRSIPILFSRRGRHQLCSTLALVFLLLAPAQDSLSEGTNLTAVAIRVKDIPIDGNLRGLGAVIGSGQHVLTSRHVVNTCPRIVVIDWKGLPHHASLTAEDERNDLAVIDVPTLEMTSLKIRDKPPLRPGEGVWHVKPDRSQLQMKNMAVGDANVSKLARRGDSRIVTLVGRSDPGAAAFRAGDSGGPVVDSAGLLVGIVAGVLPQSRAHASEYVRNIGFAINGGLVVLFLNANDIAHQTSGADAAGNWKSGAKLLDHTVVVHCLR